MTDKEKVRSVVARFFDVPESTVTESFVFPPERLHGSVGRSTFHAAIKRMAGVDLVSAWSAATFGELFNQRPVATNSNGTAETQIGSPIEITLTAGHAEASASVGIDIEHCDNLPGGQDPWTDAFYVEHFTRAEIAYCQRQPNPRESFCGLWCAKEAAMKCDGNFLKLWPTNLEIKHDAQGRPFLVILQNGRQTTKSDCAISISHSNGLSVAVCVVCVTGSKPFRPIDMGETKSLGEHRSSDTVAWIALVVGVASLLLWLFAVFKR